MNLELDKTELMHIIRGLEFLKANGCFYSELDEEQQTNILHKTKMALIEEEGK